MTGHDKAGLGLEKKKKKKTPFIKWGRFGPVG